MSAPTSIEFLDCLYQLKQACSDRIADAEFRGAAEEAEIHLKRRARIDEVILKQGGDLDS